MNRVESSSVSSEYEENDRYEGVDPSSILAGHDSDIASRYGSAIKEYDVAYQGIDYENNEVNRLSLKKISKWKSSESSKAGYAAESITVAKENSENAVSGSKDRVKRSDDIKKQTDSNGNIVGGTNDTNFDVVSVTEDGVYISNTGRQLKYRGQSADECTSIVLGKEMDRYFDVGAEMEIPEDYYDEVMENIDQKIEYERKEYEECQKKGDKTGAETHKEKVERYKQREKGIRKGKLTSKEAYYAVQNPELYTIASEAILSHKAGLEGAKASAVTSSAMSAIYNIVSVIDGNESPDEAALEVVKSGALAAASGYERSFMASALSGALKNSKAGLLRSVSKSGSIPEIIISATINTADCMKKYISGDITGSECLSQMGKAGAAHIASSIGALGGQIAIPVPVLGGLVGGIIGSSLCCGYYTDLLNSLTSKEMSERERIRVTKEVNEAISAMHEYRAAVLSIVGSYLSEYENMFDAAMTKMEQLYYQGCSDEVISFCIDIEKRIRGTAAFSGFEDHDRMVLSNEALVL